MFLAPRSSVFPVRCNQRDTQNWTLGLKVSLCKTSVDCLPQNSSSRTAARSRVICGSVVHRCCHALSAKLQSCADITPWRLCPTFLVTQYHFFGIDSTTER
ncbi:hypothetical protein TNCV_1168351 [Trichonephila clavipes]|uniref:Uncharacterized protein n=1 Tax=Trichonephila clavipes TaxID=2585209 RepID=A0A8X6T0Q6_TRICX|nr:hypothetical protein TNCV_1168351 [Trichonephila clavipes]